MYNFFTHPINAVYIVHVETLTHDLRYRVIVLAVRLFSLTPYPHSVMHECVLRIHAWLVLPPPKLLYISMWLFVVARQNFGTPNRMYLRNDFTLHASSGECLANRTACLLAVHAARGSRVCCAICHLRTQLTLLVKDSSSKPDLFWLQNDLIYCIKIPFVWNIYFDVTTLS